MLGELETRDPEVIKPRDGARRCAGWLQAELSARAAVAALAGITALSISVHIALARAVHGPFVFMDELGYEQMARSLAQTGHFALYSKTGLAYSPLYPIVLSPIYALTSSAPDAYRWAQGLNTVLMSLSVFPIYGIARFVLERRLAVGVAALAAVSPLMFYSALELSENLAYPLVLVAIWAMLRALRDPRPRNDALLLGAILLATAARLQAIVLVPAAVTAIPLVALLRPAVPEDGRLRSLRHALAQHRLLLGVLCAGAAAVLVRTIQNGGAIPFAGRYAIVGSARPAPLRVLEITVQHLAGLDFAVGVVPFAAALLATYALARAGFPRDGLLFAAVAAATTFWLLLETGFDAAAFDTGLSGGANGQRGGDLPRIHERYLVYLVPLFLVALVAIVRRAWRRAPRTFHLLVAAAAALLPAVIPFSRDINHTIVADSFSLEVFGRTTPAGTIVPIAHPTVTAVALAGVLAAVYVLAFLEGHRSLAVVATVVAFLFVSTLVLGRTTGAATGATNERNLPAHRDWVDRAVGGNDAVLVSGIHVRRLPLLETAFNNLSITRLYYVCWASFGSDFGERELTVDAPGTLRDGGQPLRARYAVVPATLGVSGRVLARDPRGGLELVAPAGGVLTVPAASRAALGCQG
jgi:Dolichyl-phosphate-mannose-protein mannosyltransferase